MTRHAAGRPEGTAVLRSLIAALAVVTTLAGTAGVAAARPLGDAGTRTATASTPTLRLLAQSVTVDADGRFTAFVSVEGAPTAAELAVDIYDRADAQDVIGDDPPAGPEATFPVVSVTPDADGRATTSFAIALYRRGEPNPDPAWGYRIDEPGVYPVRIRLRDADEETLAVMRTALVRDPVDDDEVPEPTEAAVLVEARQAPPEDSDVRATDASADASWLDDLEPVLDALDARPAVPATLALTPDSVARLAADPDDASQLAALRRSLAVDGHDLLDAPYVDIDPATLVAAGLGEELTNQRDLGRSTLTSLLEPPIAGTWRIDRKVDAEALEELRQRGIFRTVVSSSAVQGDAGVLEPAEVDAGGTAVRIATASPRYLLGAAAPGDPVLSAHRLLARLAAAATDRTDPARVVVDVAPAVTDPEALDLVLEALGSGSPWFTSSSLDQLLDAAASTEASLAKATPTNLGTYPGELTAARQELASYASMVGKQVDLVSRSERALTVSAADALDLDARRDDVDAVRHRLARQFAAIHVPAEDTVTLGARDATFPLPISSDLDVPAQVVIQLESNDRLDFPDDRIPAVLDGERTTVPIHVRTRASGDTTVRITVRSPDDGVVLAEGRYVVRSTAISGVGLLLTVGAAAFLALWWGRHWWRSRTTQRNPTPSSP